MPTKTTLVVRLVTRVTLVSLVDSPKNALCVSITSQQVVSIQSIGQNKINVLFQETSEYFLGSVGRQIFLF